VVQHLLSKEHVIPRWVPRVPPILILVLISPVLTGCGPDPAKQGLLEQLIATRSAITAGVTQITLRDREIALRTAAELAERRLSGAQQEAVATAVSAISQTRAVWSKATEGSCHLGDYVDLFGATGLYSASIEPIFATPGATGIYREIIKTRPYYMITVHEVVGPLLDLCGNRLAVAIDSLR
jgi:hypothetical protein